MLGRGLSVFSPRSADSIASGPVLRDGVMAEGRNRTIDLHTTHSGSRKDEKGTQDKI